MNTLEKIKSLDRIINQSKKVSPDIINIYNKRGRIAYAEFIQKIIPIFYEDLKTQYEKEEHKLITSYLNFDSVRVLCKGCHIATSRGLIFCKFCKDGFHTPKYDRCLKCRKKKIEETNPTARLLRKFFNISLWEQYDRNMECDCLKCGGWTFDQVQQYKVFLTKEDLTSGGSAGDFCESCFQEYQESEENGYFVKKI